MSRAVRLPPWPGDDPDHLHLSSVLGTDVREERLQRAWAALEPYADRIADTINARLRSHDPQWFEDADPSLLADVNTSTREHVRRGLEVLAGHGDPEHPASDVWRENGRRRARQGVSLELTLNAYTLGSLVLWEALLRLDSEALDLDAELLLLAGHRLWRDLHLQNAVLIDAHRRESARMARRDQHRQQVLLDRLIEGTGVDSAFAGEAADAFGVAVSEPIACVVALSDDSLAEPLRGVDDRLERAGRPSFWHTRGGTHVGLVPLGDLTPADLIAVLRPAAAARVGVGVAEEGITGFAGSYRLAARAAQTLARGRADVVAVTDRLPELMLDGSPEVASLLVRESVAPLAGHPQADVLLATLAALVRCNMSPSRAAEDLYCHRNTVLYRLKQIEELTGRDLDSPQDRLILTLGLAAVGRGSVESADGATSAG